MGGLCSKGRCGKGDDAKTKETVKSSHAVSVRQESVVEKGIKGDESVRPSSKTQSGSLVVPITSDKGENNRTFIVERPKSGHHQRRATLDMGGVNVFNLPVSRGTSIARGVEGDSVVSGWPSWLTSVAGEAIQGWVPRRADSFEKLGKIGQGTYSSVYKARDLETGKIVAMKKVRFVNMDPESVRFMAREIHILRKLDHPNVMKLEGLVTSRMSGSLYLVFEYMEHDLAGLAANPSVKFSEPQIKCYMQQLLLGLEHCHSRGVLHRDIKGSNLLLDNNGVLKIGDFGLATFFKPEQKQPLTSRVVTLWYRAPELLLGATEYGVGVDLWSTGCILAELFAGKPIMPGRTEVEQMHKILKLCGSPSEDYWRKSKFPHATSFKPHHAYRCCISETFNDFPTSSLALINVLLSITPWERGSATSALHSEFFTTKPPPCAPSALPKYPASKEFDAKLREDETRRINRVIQDFHPGIVLALELLFNGKLRKPEAKGRDAESVRGDANIKVDHSHGQSAYQGQSMIYKFIPYEDSLEPQRTTAHSSYSMVHPSAQGSLANRRRKEVGSTGRSFVASNSKPELRKQRSQASRDAEALNPHLRKGDALSTKESSTGYVPKKNRMHYSGPLVPPGGNLEDMLKEHERQIQQAVRKARVRADRNNE